MRVLGRRWCAVCRPRPRLRGWAECATTGSHGQSGEGSVGAAPDHGADTERCHSAENDDSLLGPVLGDEVLPQDAVDLPQCLDGHLGDDLPSPVLPRALGDLGDGLGALAAEQDSITIVRRRSISSRGIPWTSASESAKRVLSSRDERASPADSANATPVPTPGAAAVPPTAAPVPARALTYIRSRLRITCAGVAWGFRWRARAMFLRTSGLWASSALSRRARARCPGAAAAESGSPGAPVAIPWTPSVVTSQLDLVSNQLIDRRARWKPTWALDAQEGPDPR